jgi:hypothetical protein
MQYTHNYIVTSVNLSLIRLPRSALRQYSSAFRTKQETELSKEDAEGADGNGADWST